MLSDAKIRSLKATGKRYKVQDHGSLYVEVQPKGRKVFRTAYRLGGKVRTHTIGDFPHMTLKNARAASEHVKATARAGHDPKPRTVEPVLEEAESAPEPEPENTWRAVMLSYLEMERLSGRAPATMVKKTIHAEVTFQTLADMEITKIEAPHILEVCRHYERKGMLNSAHAVRGLCSQVFDYAEGLGITDGYDPARRTSKAIARPKNPGHNGVTDPKRVGELMAAIHDFNGSVITKFGLLLSAYLFPRNAEVRGMEWSQLDLDAAIWTAPSGLMKKKRDHVVPLSRQAVAALRFMEQVTGRSRLVLQTNSNSGLMSENTFNQALRRMGFGPEEHVHHGFRIMASTTLYENEWPGDWIERQLAHVEENKIKGAYNKALYIDGRTKMMQWYADWLDEREAEVRRGQ